MYLLFPESNYLSGAISTYSDNQCENENLGSVTVEGDGVVHTTEGQVAAEALCKAGRNDGSDYSVQASVFNHNYYKCTRLTPVPTDTEDAGAERHKYIPAHSNRYANIDARTNVTKQHTNADRLASTAI